MDKKNFSMTRILHSLRFLSYSVLLLILFITIFSESNVAFKDVSLSHSHRMKCLHASIVHSIQSATSSYAPVAQVPTSTRSIPYEYEDLKHQLSPGASGATTAALVETRQIRSKQELLHICKLCVDAFFGTVQEEEGRPSPLPDLLQQLKRRQITVQMESLFEKRCMSPSQFVDCFIIAEHTTQYLSMTTPLSPPPSRPNLHNNQYLGFSLLSLIPIDENLRSYKTSSSSLHHQHRHSSNSPTASAVGTTSTADRGLRGGYVPKISNFAVSTANRGKGIGRKLLEASCCKAAEWGYSEVFLEVEADNKAAICLYHSQGFKDIYRQSIHTYDMDSLFLHYKKKESIVMRKEL